MSITNTDDIVERLRWFANGEARAGIGKIRGDLFKEAADEIERLRQGRAQSELIDCGIYRADNGYWWMNSLVKPGFASSLRTKDRDKAEMKYREILASYRRYEMDKEEGLP